MLTQIIVSTLVVLSNPVSQMLPLSDGCDSASNFITGCVSNSGSEVSVDASQTGPGKDGGRELVGIDEGGASGRAPEASDQTRCTAAGVVTLCRGNYGVGTIPIPDVTLADIASFVPVKPSLSNEPAGLGVVGMPTNFVGAASEHAVAGRLFNTWDVTVHFVPAGFRFDYGDGTAQTTTTGGAGWSALGQAEFTPTATSHAYAARGTYPAGVTVLYTASVEFAGGIWRPVSGYVQATTGGYAVRVVEVHTALVDKTCLENPAGPGC